MEYVDVVPVFVVVLGSDAKKLGQWIGKLGIKIRIALLYTVIKNSQNFEEGAWFLSTTRVVPRESRSFFMTHSLWIYDNDDDDDDDDDDDEDEDDDDDERWSVKRDSNRRLVTS